MAKPAQKEKVPSGTAADKIAYGEIRAWAIKSMKDHSAPSGLGDAKKSMYEVSKRNKSLKNVASVDGSRASKAPDIAAWKNIVNSKGQDKSKGANYFCIGSENCDIVNNCWHWEGKKSKKKKRDKKLKAVSTVSVGNNKIYFYKDEFKGWCDAEAYRGPKK